MSKSIVVKIHETLNQRGMTLQELSQLTSIPYLTLQELANQRSQEIDINHIKLIVSTLELDDIRSLIDIIDTKN